MQETDTVYLMGDVDTIKEFVFEASSLPQIRGGSQLLVDCETEVRRAMGALGATEIYCAGGSFLFSMPAALTATAKSQIESIYREKTSVANVTITFEVHPASPDSATGGGRWAQRLRRAMSATPNGSLGHRLALLSGEIRRKKRQKFVVPFWEAYPIAKRCDTCGKRMATDAIERGTGESADLLLVCAVCHLRHTAGFNNTRVARGTYNVEFEKSFARDSGRTVQPPDLERLVNGKDKPDRDRGYVALLYADGNGIGKLLEATRDRREYEAISQGMTEGTRAAVYAALAQGCAGPLQHPDINYWPFEIVNIGGDDVTLLIHGGYAWEVGVRFLENFEHEVKHRIEQRLGQWPAHFPSRITAACGIVVVDLHYPMPYLIELVGAVLKRAKKRAKQDPKATISAIDFLWLPNAVLSGNPEARYQEYELATASVTARPYTLAQAQTIQGLVNRARHFPASQRAQWGESTSFGTATANLFIGYNISRQRTQQAMLDFIADVGNLLGNDPNPTWLHNIWRAGVDGKQRTALVDVLELATLEALRFESVQEAEDGETSD